MATLEKIRSKSVFLFIIIIVALLAFILGDFLTSGRSYFGSGTTMYKAGSNKVDYTDYQAQINNMQSQGQDGAVLEQLVMQQILMQQMLEEQYKELGINVTNAEISKIMNEQMPVSQQLSQAAQQLGLPSADRTTILDAINNPSRYGLTDEYKQALEAMWLNDEKQLEASIKQQVFFGLVGGLFTANEIDAKQNYNDKMAKTNLSYVSAPTSTINDEEVEVTDADLKAKYDELKSLFRVDVFVPANDFARMANPRMASAPIIEDTRAIDYVVVPILPSQDDLAAAEVEVNEAFDALNQQPALEGIIGKGKFLSNTEQVSRKDMSNSKLREFGDSDLVIGKVKKLRFDRGTNTHTIAKILGTSSEVDSINLSFYAAASQAEADSLLNLINNGTTIEQLLANDNQRGTTNQWNTLVGAPAEIKDRLVAEAVGTPFIFSDSTRNAYAIYLINERKAPRQYYEVAQVTYTVDPSATTVNDLRSNLNSFIASNPKADLFSANADSLYMLQHGFVSSSSAHIGNVQDSRRAVKWAMGAKKDAVSHVFETPREFLAVAITDVYDNEYVPYDAPAVKEYLTAQVKKDKKAAKLVEQFANKANDLNGYAAVMKNEVRTDSGVVFSSPRMAGHNGEPYALQGRIAAAKPGTLVGPFQNDAEVIVFTVDNPTSEGREYDFKNDGRTFTSTFGINFDMSGQRAIDPVMFRFLLGDREVKNNSLNFVADDAQ